MRDCALRRLLDDLDRDQLQALLAHLVGSIGNGDLHIAFTVTSVFETCGMLLTWLTRRLIKRRVTASGMWCVTSCAAVRRSRKPRTPPTSLSRWLRRSMTTAIVVTISRKAIPGCLQKFIVFCSFRSTMFTNMSMKITLWFFLNLLLGPCMALLWRTRRYLADASAVELTRNPDALARALQCLSEDQTSLDGGEWATHFLW